MDVILHVGAHRTGTTTLQQALRANRARLKTCRVAVWEPNQTRSMLFDGLNKAADRVTPAVQQQGRDATDRIRAEADQLQKDGAQALIVSDENMLGAIPSCVITGRLYPDAARRLARFRPAFKDTCVRIGVSIRAYDRHWASMLGFTVKRAGRVPDRDQCAALSRQPRRWRDVISELSVVFPKAELLVWPFEAMVDAPEHLVHALTGRRLPVPLKPIEAVHNPGPTLSELRGIVGDGAYPGHMSRLPAADDAPWSPFDQTERARLRAAYDEDIRWLRQTRNPAITYIESPEDIAGLTDDRRGVRDDEKQRHVG